MYIHLHTKCIYMGHQWISMDISVCVRVCVCIYMYAKLKSSCVWLCVCLRASLCVCVCVRAEASRRGMNLGTCRFVHTELLMGVCVYWCFMVSECLCVHLFTYVCVCVRAHALMCANETWSWIYAPVYYLVSST